MVGGDLKHLAGSLFLAAVSSLFGYRGLVLQLGEIRIDMVFVQLVHILA